MKIAAFEVINLHAEYPDRKGFLYSGGLVTSRVTSLVRVTTESGLTGLGAAYSYPDLVRIIIERHLGPLLIGDDPQEVEALWDKMYRLTRWYGRKGVALSALGALDMAFWDLRGKASGTPVYKLLGAERDTVPAYASGLFWHDELKQLEMEATRHLERGFRRVKMRLGHSQAYDEAALEAVRRAVGSEGDILVDGSHRYQLDTAERLGKLLAAQKVFWFEEPFPPKILTAMQHFALDFRFLWPQVRTISECRAFAKCFEPALWTLSSRMPAGREALPSVFASAGWPPKRTFRSLPIPGVTP